jgi:UDP-N-acetylglucosamine 2-epimerase (non-hydrolysing)
VVLSTLIGGVVINKINVLIVFGTRPEAIKMVPLIGLLKNDDRFNTLVCNSSQHFELVESVIKEYKIVVDYDLKVFEKGQSLESITIKVIEGISNLIRLTNPHYVLVHGDTTTTFSSSLAAFYNQVKVLHVEAGLRTFNRYSPFPEEFNRTAVSLMAYFHFAPTSNAAENLIKEGVDCNKILVTGNTIIDLVSLSYNSNFKSPILDWIGEDKFIVLTAHRRENLMFMPELFRAIRDSMLNNPSIKLVYPIHKNPKIIEMANTYLSDVDNIRIVDPLDTNSFHNILARSYFVITDSGGVQEEAPTFNIPVVLLRTSTERPEALNKGIILAGVEYSRIVEVVNKLIDDSFYYLNSKPLNNPFGDGKASARIIEKIKSLNENSSI